MNKLELPKIIPVFPLSNFIIFPKTTVPLNIFEPRYIDMINDSMKSNKIIGMIQPKSSSYQKVQPELHGVGCAGKITSFNETEDGRYLIVLNGLSRFQILNEISTDKLYRICEVNYKKYSADSDNIKEKVNFSSLVSILKDLKSIFDKKGYAINWSELKKQDMYNTVNTLSMASPISLEEKQTLLESLSINDRKSKLENILKTYLLYEFGNNTLQ